MHLLTPRRSAVLSGLLATVAALAAGELAAGLVPGWTSPVEAVGLSVIDLVPGPVERWAIENLGSNDKPALIGGTLALVLLLGCVLGAVARTRFRVAAAGVVALGLVGVAATAFQTTAVDGVPSVVTAVVGVAVLALLTRRAAAATPATTASAGTPADDRMTDDTAPDGTAADRVAPAVDRSAGMRAGAADRRAFLGLAGGIALASAAAAVGGRTLAGRQGQAVEAARASIASEIAGATGASPDAVGSATERALGQVDSPLPPLPDGVDFGIDGLAPFVTPEEEFYRVDAALVVPRVDPDGWSLRIHGMVDREVEYGYEELLRRPDLMEADITLTCVSNEVGGDLVSSARWTGVPLANLLAEAGVQSGADQVVGRSVDDWTGGFPVDVATDGRNAIVALLMNGQPLPADRGFPARLVVPGLYGYVSATKWLTEIELTTFDDFDMYWVQRGWDERAPIKTQSRIDVPAPLERVAPGEVVVAGVAWDQTVGIQKVEIRVDDGEWNEADLAVEANADTWRQWRWAWPDATPGSHRLTVRATNANGEVQTEERQPPFPNGASGWMTLLVTVAEGA
ncbi:molybdopterin-dependent oxidoreductase [Euzebya rosea]|uniref:molybdopterin-dependent oxidoreductase n=1 Tax=Euzebya rosea TaxID=2052804 RepID=UPI000D3E9302|nr:molybdopterin-dependent oxidoreductase [Euzebya rosea]